MSPPLPSLVRIALFSQSGLLQTLLLRDHLLLDPATTILQLLPLTTALPTLLPSAGTTVHMVSRLRSAEPLDPGRETSCPAGGCIFPSCWPYQFLSCLSWGQADLGGSWWTLLPWCPFYQLLLLPLAPESSFSLLMDPLLPALVPGSFLSGLVLFFLIGLSSWLLSTSLSLGQIFYAITTSFSTFIYLFII